ncbi:MAG: preprotein translocase subunit SecG [Nitrospinota bacterium]
MTETLVTVLHVVVAFVLILIVLLQSGKGASMGAAFGGSSQTVFGSRGPAGFMSKLTTGAAIIFMLTSLALSMISAGERHVTILEDAVPPPSAEEPAPVAEPPAEAPSAGSIDPFETPPPADEAATEKDTGTPTGEK